MVKASAVAPVGIRKRSRECPLRMKTPQQKAERYARENEQAARIILRDPQRYQGLMLEWARAVIAKAEEVPFALAA